ncbi:MAG TPA: gamma-glutamyltransferase family protein [Chloroflexia bacterium]|nr:gamma-glutamyltransferase family protein [Chloroflexia bacterium]
MDLNEQTYPSRRLPIVAQKGVVATSQPLAAQAGLTMLQRGGNACDAALATAIALTVLEPTSNGIGADAFALLWDGSALHGLNGSGRAPAAASIAAMRAGRHTQIPARGWLPVTVPGAPAAWRDLHARFGRLPFPELFKPAIGYATDGYPVSPITAHSWRQAAKAYASLTGPEFAGWPATFTPQGKAPQPGEIWASPGHARTLQQIAESNAEAFYQGEIARAVADFAANTGGLLTERDLAEHTSTWVDPIHATYHDHDIWEIPPNGQGITTLIALNILAEFDLAATSRESVESYHLQIEALKLAYADALAYIADPEKVPVPVEALLSREYARERSRLIGNHALVPAPGTPPSGGTVYLCTADADGMMVSFIQSNYMGFGSGVVVPGWGIALQNRGHDFRLDPAHPNHLAPGKRPYHTIIPGFLTRDGQAIGPFGVMGGYMQPQGHMQMAVNMIDYHMNPQTSLDAPRWQWTSGRTVLLEDEVPRPILEGLALRGHDIRVEPASGAFGRGQIIHRLSNGVYVAGSEKRADGAAVGY